MPNVPRVQGAEMTTLDLAEMMEQQMSGEDAMEIAFSLGMPRVLMRTEVTTIASMQGSWERKTHVGRPETI